jgi:hypothetical protein
MTKFADHVDLTKEEIQTLQSNEAKRLTGELDIVVSTDANQISFLIDQGFTPVECSIDGRSIVDDLEMDHHGNLSDKEGVAIRAYRDHFGARKDRPWFVIARDADEDASFACAALAGILPHPSRAEEFKNMPWLIPSMTKDLSQLADTINKLDTDPIGFKKTELPEIGTYLAWVALTMFKGGDNLGGVTNAGLWRNLTTGDPGLLKPILTGAFQAEEVRLASATLSFDESNYEVQKSGEYLVRAVQSNVWGFDVWYQRQRKIEDPRSAVAWSAPVVIWHKSMEQRIDIGCPNNEIAEALFGEGGLKNVFPVLDAECSLGAGWGGRESIGGGPSAINATVAQAHEAAHIVSKFLNK